MAKKKRIKELERRLATVEAELAAQRTQRITWIPPTIPTPYPGAWPQITCTATPVDVDSEQLAKRLQRHARVNGMN